MFRSLFGRGPRAEASAPADGDRFNLQHLQ